jgi:LysR family transcriptional regulator, low CO2-responsive transcriptional regulator
MTAFKEQYPGPRLSLYVRNDDKLLEALKERHIDVAVHASPPRGHGLGVIPFSIDPVVVCVGIGHALEKRKSVRLEELSGETLIVREKGCHTRTLIDNTFDKAGLPLDDALETDEWESVRELVRAGLGISLMSVADCGIDKRMIQIPLIDPSLEVTEYLVFDPDRRRLKTVRAFLDMVEKMTGEPWYKL